MSRILALDFGTKRIGVAMSDELLMTAQGSETIYRQVIEKDIARIADLVKANAVSEVVVGLPISMNGTHSAKTKEVIEFADILSKALEVPVKTWDERLTSIQVERTLIAADVSRYKRKLVTDKLAAIVILQSYLDSRKKGPT